MRELKDYFCNFEQTQDLLKLGLSEKYGISAEQYETAEFGYSGFLRSQTLDYFRELGWYGIIEGTQKHGFEWLIDRDFDKYIKPPNNYSSYNQAESALIDKLIELEKEARNENK